MGIGDVIGMVAKWSYFVVSIIAILGAFVHLNIQFQEARCSSTLLDTYELLYDIKASCVGRNLLWLKSDQLGSDSNAEAWRGVFSLQPDIFIDVWTPFFFAFISFFQNFKGAKWALISGSWIRAFLWVIFWMLFGVFGYAANWGVFLGFVGMCYLAVLYLIMIFVGSYEDDAVLQLNVLALAGKMGNPRQKQSTSVPNEGVGYNDDDEHNAGGANGNGGGLASSQQDNPDNE